MKISLVVTTNDRVKIFERLLKSIENNIYKDVELIVIDQNQFNENDKLINAYKEKIKIIHYKTNKIISLSKARNIGLKFVTGDIIGFPDDDCWYEKDFLCRLKSVFLENNWDAICTSVYDPIRKQIYGNKQSKNDIEIMNMDNVIKFSTSVGIFVRKSSGITKFDENLGVGSKWFGGEDIDYVCQYINKNKIVYFVNPLKVYHEIDEHRTIEKELRYSTGYGAILKKMYVNYNYKKVKIIVYKRQLKSLIGIYAYKMTNKNKSDMYLNKYRGVKKGFEEWC